MKNNFTIDEIKNFWDRVAPIYELANKKVGYVHTQRFEKTIEYGNFKEGQTILNIWSRTGNLLPYLRRIPHLTVYNREASPKMMAIAQRKYPDEKFALTDLEDLSEFSTEMFDRVVSLETLEHTPKPLVFLKELNRVLKPGGLLIMSLPPGGFEIPTRIYDFLGNNHGEGPHLFLWPGQVRKLLKDSGFRLLKHESAIILPLGNEKLTRMSEKMLTKLFGRTSLANFGVRHFYVATK